MFNHFINKFILGLLTVLSLLVVGSTQQASAAISGSAGNYTVDTGDEFKTVLTNSAYKAATMTVTLNKDITFDNSGSGYVNLATQSDIKNLTIDANNHAIYVMNYLTAVIYTNTRNDVVITLKNLNNNFPTATTITTTSNTVPNSNGTYSTATKYLGTSFGLISSNTANAVAGNVVNYQNITYDYSGLTSGNVPFTQGTLMKNYFSGNNTIKLGSVSADAIQGSYNEFVDGTTTISYGGGSGYVFEAVNAYNKGAFWTIDGAATVNVNVTRGGSLSHFASSNFTFQNDGNLNVNMGSSASYVFRGTGGNILMTNNGTWNMTSSSSAYTFYGDNLITGAVINLNGTTKWSMGYGVFPADILVGGGSYTVNANPGSTTVIQTTNALDGPAGTNHASANKPLTFNLAQSIDFELSGNTKGLFTSTAYTTFNVANMATWLYSDQKWNTLSDIIYQQSYNINATYAANSTTGGMTTANLTNFKNAYSVRFEAGGLWFMDAPNLLSWQYNLNYIYSVMGDRTFYAPRNGSNSDPMNFTIRDTRDMGTQTNQGWRLIATATDMISDSDGISAITPVFNDIDDTMTPVDEWGGVTSFSSNVTSLPKFGATDSMISYDNSHGIIAPLNINMNAGTYSGVINWTLVDAAQ